MYMKNINTLLINNIPSITCEELYANASKFCLIDVRREDEFNNELGHIENSQRCTLGAELTQFLTENQTTKPIVFICRSGQRSATATQESIDLGYKNTFNLIGGMIDWNQKKFSVVREEKKNE